MPYTLDQEKGDQTLNDMVKKGIEVMEDDPEGSLWWQKLVRLTGQNMPMMVTTMHEVYGLQESGSNSYWFLQ